MEDAARLAQIEMRVNNNNAFENLLKELLQLINNILDDPHDRNFRKLKSDVLTPLLKYEEFGSYLKYIGFELENEEYVFPQEQTLSKLKSAYAAIEQKIIYCYGQDNCYRPGRTVWPRQKIPQLKPLHVLDTNNHFLQTVQKLFNDVLVIEDEELLEYARSHIPLTQLEVRACERMREHQKKIKTGKIKGEDMPFELALLAELVSWFKHQFFTWVDKPPCQACGGETRLTRKTNQLVDGEMCLVEKYRCTQCPHGKSAFPRLENPRALLRARRGRCGEYGKCFTLLCRALGYDTRYVYDITDHVWCEVFDYASNSWIHVDPCEAAMDAPLMYSHGWGKRLSYVIAVSRDDLQDVTWRYTTNHKEVLTRRKECSEAELLSAILKLREARQAQLGASRRRSLAARTLRELVDMMVERSPDESESRGRLSGSLAWRRARGEGGDSEHVFHIDTPGLHTVRYNPSVDEYRVSVPGVGGDRVAAWERGAFRCRAVFRKLEADWKQVYLAREEGEVWGSVSWKLSAGAHVVLRALAVRATSAVYDTGRVHWTLQFDDEDPLTVQLGDKLEHFNREFTSVVITATLSGGSGAVAWQHAQLFRQSIDSDHTPFEIHIQADEKHDADALDLD